jgi:hypothetical protein
MRFVARWLIGVLSRRGGVGACVLVCAFATSALGASGASASTEPFFVEAVACPSTAQCTISGSIVGTSGPSPYQVTISPGSAAPISSGFQGDGLAAGSLACPTATQCTGTLRQSEVTFDPTTGAVNAAGAKQLLTTGSGANAPSLGSLSCPAATQCTASVQGVGEVTFDPGSGTLISSAVLLSGDTGPVACPSTSQCSMVNNNQSEVTFDPMTGTPNAAGTAVLAPPYWGLVTLACSSATQCTAGSPNGYEYTFTPSTGQITVVKQVFVPNPFHGTTRAVDLQCPSATQCTAIGEGGDEVTFDPTTDTANAAGHVSLPGVASLSSLSCPSVDQCTAVGTSQEASGSQHALVITFDPATGAAGAATALTGPSFPTPPPTPPTPVPPSAPKAPAAPTAKQISSALSSALTVPKGAKAKIAALLRAGSYSYAVSVAVPGTLASKWYYLPKGARLASAKVNPILVAKGAVRLTKGGRLKMMLTMAGRKLLKKHVGKHAKALSLTAQASYAPKGRAARSSKRRFVLRP